MRSQMAEGLLRADLGDRIEVFSAGTHPSFVHPAVIAVMLNIGIDIRQHRSKSVNEFLEDPLDLVITVCDFAADRCPVLPLARKQIHKAYPDPTRDGVSSDPAKNLAVLRDLMRIELREVVTSELGL